MADVRIQDVSYENAALVNVPAGTVLVQDLVNTTTVRNCATSPAAALAVPLGIAMEPSQLDSAGAVRANAGWTVRIWGRTTAVAAGAIAIGDHVSIANVAGQVQTQVRALAGAQPAAIVGIAQTATTAAGQGVEIDLTRGATW